MKAADVVATPVVVKKYGNRRLYDTTESRYITLEELAERIRGGDDVQVVDAKSGKDLTQQTLAHIILESRGAAKLLPVPLLKQLVRMGDDALAEFFGMYVSSALELYLHARSGAQAMVPYNPFAQIPMAATNAFARMFGGWGQPAPPPQPAPPARPSPPPPEDDTADQVAALRRELQELKDALRPKGREDDET
ncbi:MAG: polyhydroxyalkanoate synthesis regulator DNA-binding domain-containing protein [Myxococcota bacterium]|nr:polyhydroxyalkanoate synthesis regulator DNA-binding domain-containing protein [Myxococcota bacterium]